MINKLEFSQLAIVLLFVAGCGGVRSVTGGTAGELLSGGEALGDVQVTIHQVDGTSIKTIGFAATKVDGSFELVTPGAKGPLRLSPGEYCCTLESVGAPIVIAKEYTKAETTPLKVTWTSSNTNLDLEFRPARKAR